MYATTHPYTPPSSPPSSPIACADSSPQSSPGFGPLSLSEDEDVPPVVIDPLAGNFKATRTPPIYEKNGKRTRMPPTPPSSTPKRARHAYRVPSTATVNMVQQSPISSLQYTTKYPLSDNGEEEIWDAAVELAMETGSRNIDLMARELTTMPEKFVKDLSNVVVLPQVDKVSPTIIASANPAPGHRTFSRVHTAPASINPFHSRGFGERAHSIANVSLMNGISRSAVQLFLSGNRISRIPLELWGLKDLTLLSLRGNLLTYLPPEIARLKNLRTLNVAQNRLKFVPAELMDMQLNELNLHPNPFLLPPSSSLKRLGTPVSETKVISQDCVPTLTELCFRILFSSPSSTTANTFSVQEPTGTLLHASFALPIPEYGRQKLPQHVRDILEICVPGSTQPSEVFVSSTRSSIDERAVTGIGICANPEHRKQGRVFVRHMEERFTWESKIAGKPAGGAVPVRWRGCMQGCLDFLDPVPTKDSPEHDTDIEMEDGDVDVVQAVQFGAGPGGFDEEELGFDD
ncbi:hypothetical protein BDQ12DRAFT_734704 [Crucibulum laeve]|uniref:Uncharacterized protein n=1 Tax=Crucibulum laeve TaxID=68775 RepID=A0A5C3M446_9AGAR|nr:hypothetical protein BDQ12DRAFT_734704 [Crucibulum laeve]